MNGNQTVTKNIERKQFPCTNCGGKMEFAVGTRVMRCPYCQAEQAIPETENVAAENTAAENSTEDKTTSAQFVENDYLKFLQSAEAESAEQTVHCTHCNSCGANVTLDNNKSADLCPYCTAPVVVQDFVNRAIAVQGLLPFKIDNNAAYNLFRGWLKSLWFAPNNLCALAIRDGCLSGIYLPYWTYDSATMTQYRGQRGVYYYTTESSTDSKGKTSTRQVRHTNWSPASGIVDVDFDDILVPASTALPTQLIDALEPWDLPELTNYAAEFLAGYRAETYQINLPDGFKIAQTKMAAEITRAIRADIGGDEQRIDEQATQYDDITFKHILLPLWISAYRYQQKIFRFAINGRTGEVQGERPYSWLKITATILGGAAILAGAYYLLQPYLQ